MRRWYLGWAMTRENHDPKLYLLSERTVGSVSHTFWGGLLQRTAIIRVKNGKHLEWGFTNAGAEERLCLGETMQKNKIFMCHS